ncbi:hypothetical protein BN110_005 [Yersinia phage phiR8-01]|uniref:Bacteriophage T7 tail fibre protein-like N-terminal domain-containing protein n=1 Tax=Yersinia phage phiR8-01 TaxID=1206556 RepID=A0A1K2IXM4_9CAUD|nr:tail fiber protein [Yersinia phage phiR8-01]SGA03417.1 hypothetical protein BN110_005 [Yersinia phage phiR8-01]
MDPHVQPWYEAAKTGKNYYSMNEFPGTGSDTFDINFAGGYLDKTHVKAYMVKTGETDIELLALTFLTAARVKTSKPVPIGYKCVIYRDTPKSVPMLSFKDGAPMTAINLDRNAMQSIFSAAEMVDRYESTTATVGEIGGVVVDFDKEIKDMRAIMAKVQGQITSSVFTTATSSTYEIVVGQVATLRVGLTQPTTTLKVTAKDVPGATNRLTLFLRQDRGANKVIWPDNIRWPNFNAPPLSWTQGAEDVFELYTPDSGSTWYGMFSGGWY